MLINACDNLLLFTLLLKQAIQCLYQYAWLFSLRCCQKLLRVNDYIQRTPQENIMKNQSGFTLIELVLVIIVLGILSATAMPRFVNLSDDAKRATYVSTRGAMQEAVNLVHMKWTIDGQPIPVGKPLDGYQVGDIYINLYGYPRFLTGTQECDTIFAKLLPGSEAIPKENIDSHGNGGTGGRVCEYYSEKISEKKYLYLITYDEDSGNVELQVDPPARN